MSRKLRQPVPRTQSRVPRRQSGRAWLVAVLVGVAAAALYLPTLSYPLVWDDIDLVQLNRDKPLAAFGQSFWHGDAARKLGRDVYYRPLSGLSLRLDRAIGGEQARHYHLVNCLLHGLCAALVCAVGLAAGAPLMAAGAVGLLFGLHPMLADSAAYVSGRTDVLCGIGVALCLVGLLRWLRSGRRREWLAVWLGTAVALLAKETALVLAVAVPVGLLVARRGRLSKADWLVAGGSIAITFGYLAARAAVLGSVSLSGSAAGVALLALNNAGRTVVLGVAPFLGRVFAWDGAALARPTLWLVPLAVLLAVGLFAARPGRQRESLVLWLSGVLLLVPAAALAQYGPLGRSVYLPAVALLPLAGLALGRLAEKRPATGRAAAVAALALAVAFVPAALGRARVWRDGFWLFSRMTREAPGYAAGHFNLAFELRRRGDEDGAIAAYRRVIALDSTAGLAWSNLGALLQAKGRLAEAAAMYRTTVRLLPDYALARNNLGIVLYRLGDAEGAVRELGEALRLNPRDAGAAYNLARVLQRTGRVAAALESAERAAQLEPANELYQSTVRELRESVGGVVPP